MASSGEVVVGEVVRVLGGRYEVGELLGRGGMAEVHAGRDQRLGRRVAIKLMRPELARDPVLQARFRREARSVAGLNHPGIVAVHDTGEDTSTGAGGEPVRTPYMVMELVDGRTVRDLLDDADGAGLGTRRAVEVAAGVLTALQAAHDAGIVHRDVKPANAMVTPDGGVKVMDFGIARSVVDSSATMTQTDSVMGTALYLSPEQARGEVVDARTDQYSCACLLYEALTGRPPFVGDYPVAVAYQHVSELPQPPSALNAAVDGALDRVVLKALSKARADRYDDAAQFRDDLLAALAGRAVLAPLPPPVAPSVPQTPAPRRGGRAAVALAAALLVAVVPLSGWLPDREVPASDRLAAQDATGAVQQQSAIPLAAQGGAGATDTSPSTSQSTSQSTGSTTGDRVTSGTPVLLAASSAPASTASTDASPQGAVDVAAAASRVTVADYAGQSVEAASRALQALGLTAAPTTEPSTRPAGEVLRQSPAGGTSLSAGGVVVLTVSAGSPPPSGGATTSTSQQPPAPSPATTSADLRPAGGGSAGGAAEDPPGGGGAAEDPGPGRGAERGQGSGAGHSVAQGRDPAAAGEGAQQGRSHEASPGRGSGQKG